MTEQIDLVAIATEIETLRSNLAKASAAIDIVGKPAVTKAEQIAASLEAAKIKYDNAVTSEKERERLSRFALISDLSISYDKESDNLINTAFKIRYTKVAYDMRLNDNVPRSHVCNGFAALPAEVYEYLVTVRADAIPAPIMALAPSDPQEAMSAYFTAVRRGFIRTKPA